MAFRQSFLRSACGISIDPAKLQQMKPNDPDVEKLLASLAAKR